MSLARFIACLALLLVGLSCLVHAQAPPQDCNYSAWSTWSLCNQTDCLTGGFQTRRRTLDSGLSTCDLPITEIQACNSCRKDCLWSPWSKWSNCTAPCDKGSKVRSRSIVTQSQYGGAVCEGNYYETTACQLADCSIACQWSSWSQWSSCNQQCGGGIRTRWITNQRNATMTDAVFNSYGVTCDLNVTIYGTCNTKSCYVCEWADWTSWSPCTATCGEGQQSRTRNVTRGLLNDTTSCEDFWSNSHGYTICNHGACPEDINAIAKHVNTIAIVAGVVGFIIIVAVAVVLFFHCRNSKKPLNMPWAKKKADIATPETDSDMKVVELTEPN